MTGVQTSVGWAVFQAAEALAAGTEASRRQAGRALRCCEVVGLDKAPECERESYTQGVRVHLLAYTSGDYDAISAEEGAVKTAISQTLGQWGGAVQIELALLGDAHSWIGAGSNYSAGGGGSRLHKYYTEAVIEKVTKRGGKNVEYLAERPGEVNVLLRRIRYRLGLDYGQQKSVPTYAYWTTPTTERWAEGGGHELNYIVSRLSVFSPDLKDGHADSASGIDPGYWGEVDTEEHPLRVGELTTRTGVTRDDVRAVLDRAGSQVCLDPLEPVDKSDLEDPTKTFLRALEQIAEEPDELDGIDVLLVHRGGGIEPTIDGYKRLVGTKRKRELRDACVAIRDLGVEVVVALGHGDVSVLRSTRRQLPLGYLRQ